MLPSSCYMMSEQCGPWSTWEAYEDHILDHCKRDQQYDGRSSTGHRSTCTCVLREP